MKLALRATIALAALACAGSARADTAYRVVIRIISAQPDAGGIDPALAAFASDLRALPYRSFKLLDHHEKRLARGETVSMQFPGPGRRFLRVTANGVQAGKASFTLAIRELDFRTTVRIRDGGTLVVAGPKYGRGVILLAVTARRG